MNDLISRQQAIDALLEMDKKLRNINWYDNTYAEGECRGIDEAITIINNLSCVQTVRKQGKLATTDTSDMSFCPRCGGGLEGEKAVADLPELGGVEPTK